MLPASAAWGERTAGIRWRARGRSRFSKRSRREGCSAAGENLGNRLEARAREWKRKHPLIGDVRGLGAMRAIELVRSPDKREPAKEETEQVLRYCHEHGL